MLFEKKLLLFSGFLFYFKFRYRIKNQPLNNHIFS
jgi:hypothetical protein